MDPEGQALSAPTPPAPLEAQALTTPTPTPGASSSTIQTVQTNPRILQSAMKTPTEKLQKQGSESPKGSLRFLLPGPVFCVREGGIGDEEEEDGNRVGCEDGECSSDDDEGLSQRSLLGSRRGIKRRKRREIGRRGWKTGRGWWRDWREALALWIVLIVLGSAMGFVFLENAEEEIPMPGDPGQGSSEGKRLFSLMSILGWGSEKQEVGPMVLEDSMKLMGRGVDFVEALELELDLDLHKREVPDNAKWLYDAQDPSYDLVPDNATDRDKLIESRNGAVSSDVEICSETGVGLMRRGGNAVDAIIGEFSCPQFSGTVWVPSH